MPYSPCQLDHAVGIEHCGPLSAVLMLIVAVCNELSRIPHPSLVEGRVRSECLCAGGLLGSGSR